VRLPALATQSLYLDISWGIVVSALIVTVLSTRRASPIGGRGEVAATCAGVFVCMWLPGAASPSFWLGLAFQHPSPLLVGLCGLQIVRVARSRPDHRGVPVLPSGPAATLTALGLLLYAGTFLWLPYDVYQYGYWGFAAATATTVLVVFWWGLWPSSRTLCAVAASVALLHATTRLPSGNAWDALLDPLLVLWAATVTFMTILKSARRRVAA